MIELLLLYFYTASLWLRRFLGGGPLTRSICSVFPLHQMPWRSIIVLLCGFLHEHLPIFDGQSKFVMWWLDFSESYFGSSWEISQLQVQCVWVVKHWRSWPLRKCGLYLGSSWLYRGHPSWGKGGCNPLSIYLLCSGYILHCSIGAVCCRISLFSILLQVFHQDLKISYF